MLTIGLSAVLIVTLIILFACISENISRGTKKTE